MSLSRCRDLTGAVIVTVAGRVEGAAAFALNRYLHGCLDEHPAVLVVDLKGVAALDGDALWILYQVGQPGQRENCEVRITGASPAALHLAITPPMPPAVLDLARMRSHS